MVMTTSEASTASGVRILGLLAVMSMPSSFIASTATGLIWSAGADPAVDLEEALVTEGDGDVRLLSAERARLIHARHANNRPTFKRAECHRAERQNRHLQSGVP